MTDILKIRINISDINQFDKGTISGRLISVNSDSIFITDQSGIVELIKTDKCPVKEGDILVIQFEKDNKKPIAKKIIIINSPINNPIKDQKSLFNKLNKNNKKLLSVLLNRQNFFIQARNFFYSNNFIEIHSPTLVESPGIEKHIEPFRTNYFDIDDSNKILFLPTSPEFSLKEALTAGLEKIFEIAKVFRNYGENSDLHNPEFFMLEWYRAYENYEKIMDDCYNFINFLNDNIYKYKSINYNNNHQCMINKIDKIKVKDMFNNYNINLDNYSLNQKKFIADISSILKINDKYINENNLTKEDLFFKFFINFIEPTLGFDNPVILYEYPSEMATLSENCPDNPIYAKRFELYICGIEIANAYQELIDPIEQEKRFMETLDFRKLNKKVKLNKPIRFLNALKNGMPPSSGIALGIERLFMIFEGLTNIKDANLFDFHK